MSHKPVFFVLVDEEDQYNAYQFWGDSEGVKTDIGELIVIMANRSTLQGCLNEGKEIFSFFDRPKYTDRVAPRGGV